MNKPDGKVSKSKLLFREVGFNQKHNAAREIPASYYRKIKLTDLISSMLKNLTDYRFQKKSIYFVRFFNINLLPCVSKSPIPEFNQLLY